MSKTIVDMKSGEQIEFNNCKSVEIIQEVPSIRIKYDEHYITYINFDEIVMYTISDV